MGIDHAAVGDYLAGRGTLQTVGVQYSNSNNVDFTLRTAPTFIKSRARNTIIITPTIIISPKRVIFVGTRISIRFQLTLIGFQTYISGIIIAWVSRDGDRSIEGGGGGGGGYFINAKSTLIIVSSIIPV